MKIKIIGLVIGFFIMLVASVFLPGRTLPTMEANDLVLVREGQSQWRKNNCSACHSIYGLGGHMGPDLTDIAERFPEIYIKARIQGGGAGMPPFEAVDTSAIFQYLKFIGSSGTYPPSRWPAPYYGERP